MSLINISNLTFNYDGSYDYIFKDVSFQIDTDWKLGFVGRNGKGKTTFLNLLMGKYEYKGSISSSVTFSYFPYQIKNDSINTIDVINSICKAELWEIKRELSLLEVSEEILNRAFNTLSNGEQTKVLIASMFLKENNFLLIDEPTNHLDMNARKIVSDYLNSKKGFILVSHDRAFLDKIIDHVLSINKENIEIQKGNFSTWKKNKEMSDNYEMAENEKLQKDIKKLTIAAKQTANWADKVEKTKIGEGVSDTGYVGHKAAKMMKRSKVIEARRNKAVQEKSLLLKNIEIVDELFMSPLTEYKKKNLIEAKNLVIKYDDRIVTSNVNFSIDIGDRVSLNGKNGSGKSSILKLILGENISYDGKINIGSNLIVSYVPQNPNFLKGYLSEFAKKENIDESRFKTLLNKLDFSKMQFEKDMSELSSGQKKKVLLAKSLCESAHLYIWDEPLNYIDIFSRMQIEELILKYKPTLLFVEHDMSFNENIATKKVQI